ncbi:MAG: hypothetical protein HKN14_10510 [Marinicaulis sp.]|nr:hypothetical protein [Marinicaulis sp.]NNE41334.1 hypothetical protein [Marinicaulis sp.]NNL87648.1 hypothetical protein [Marinicaulis sp.]
MLEPNEQATILAAENHPEEEKMMLGSRRGDDIKIHLSEKNGHLALN